MRSASSALPAVSTLNSSPNSSANHLREFGSSSTKRMEGDSPVSSYCMVSGSSAGARLLGAVCAQRLAGAPCQPLQLRQPLVSRRPLAFFQQRHVDLADVLVQGLGAGFAAHP